MTGGVLTVLSAGPLATVQDAGRPGLAHLGVPRAGALDRPAYALGNRLVGNDEGAASVEITLGGFEATVDHGCWVAVTGAPGPVAVDGAARGHGRPEWLQAGARLTVGAPAQGVRSYLAVAGGIAVAPVLGSRSTDVLGWVGPPRVVDGAELPVGPPTGRPAPLDTPRPRVPGALRVRPGPRLDWFDGDPLRRLCGTTYAVDASSDRIGLRLEGEPLRRSRHEELPSEGMVLGAVQVPPSGLPVVFLADHPATGGYPVVAVVEAEDLWQCAQVRPGDPVRFTRA